MRAAGICAAALAGLVATGGCSFIASATGVYKPTRESPPQCSHHVPQSVDWSIAGPFALATAVIGGLTATDTHSMNRGTLVLGLVEAAIITGVFVGSAVYGASRNADCEAELAVRVDEEARATANVEHADRERREKAFVAAKAKRDAREHAILLGKQAGDAARAGDCATVTKLDAEVCTSDPEYRDAVFLRDVAIARCLGAAPPACAPSPASE